MDTDNATTVDTTVVPTVVPTVETPAVNPNIEVILVQKKNFISQLDIVKKEMSDCQQKFEKAKVLGIKLEGALESLELLLKSLQK